MEDKVKDILKKYEARLKTKVSFKDYEPGPIVSREYTIFRKELLSKKLGSYEKLSNLAEKIIKIKPNKEKRQVLIKSIEAAHLRITPEAASSFAALVAALFLLIAIGYGVFTFVITGTFGFFVPIMFLFFAVIALFSLQEIPNTIAARWRLKASNQMVLCILYIVMYMRHTSNLEHALKFATDHIGKPLSLDLRKVLWNIETEKYTTVKESLDHYLESWKDDNIEFVEAFHLIEGSLYEPDEARRVSLLEKSLSVMLDGTYEKMLHYAHNLKNPITMLHMLGVVLPILGLVILPLIGAFLGGLLKWPVLAFIYNIFLPLIVYLVGTNILAKRPTGYGEQEITELVPMYKQLEKTKFLNIEVSPAFFGIVIAAVFFSIGFLPLLLHVSNPDYDISLGSLGNFLDYKQGMGPFGVVAMLFSFLIPLGLGLGIGTYYKLKTRKLIKIRDATKKLEKEFAGSLFQLGNRIGDGIPAEAAFGKVANSTKGTPTGVFFKTVYLNITRLGMSLKEAIFNKKTGAILLYPSALIESSMKVLIQSAKKGPKVVSKSLIGISEYVNRIHRVNERLRDLMADIISSMKGQISFLTPIIAGIVVGLASMIVNILNRLGEQFSNIAADEAATFNVAAIANIFRIQDTIPSYYFQLIVGIYVVEIVILLSILANGIENGSDKLNEKYEIGKNLYRSTLLYVIIAVIVTLIFNFLAAGILTVTQGL